MRRLSRERSRAHGAHYADKVRFSCAMVRDDIGNYLPTSSPPKSGYFGHAVPSISHVKPAVKAAIMPIPYRRPAEIIAMMQALECEAHGATDAEIIMAKPDASRGSRQPSKRHLSNAGSRRRLKFRVMLISYRQGIGRADFLLRALRWHFHFAVAARRYAIGLFHGALMTCDSMTRARRNGCQWASSWPK